MTTPSRLGPLRRRIAALVAAVAVAAGLQTTVLTSTASAAACGDITVVGVRGTTEEPGYGATVGPVVERLMGKFNPYLAGAVPLDYPARAFDYAGSVREGVTNLTKYIDAVRSECPAMKFILVGHSQGAHVVADTVAASDFGGSIVGVGMTGDPMFKPNRPGTISVDKPTGQRTDTQTNGGVFGHRADYPDWVQPKIRSVCLMTDSICDSSSLGGSLWSLWQNPDDSHQKYMSTPGLGYGALTSYVADEMYALAGGAGGSA